MKAQQVIDGADIRPRHFANGHGKVDGSALRKAVRKQLRRELCRVRFIKADGSKRTMYCSLNPTFLPKKESGAVGRDPKALNRKAMLVWDIEAEGWRTFKLEGLIRLTVLEPG